MKGKILFLTGLGLGYVLGTRAGRERYEQIKAAVGRVWNDPRVQHQVDSVGAYVKDKAPDLAEMVTDRAKKVAAQVAGTKKPATRSTASKSPTASGTTRSTSSTRAKRSTGSSGGSS